jgi:transposase
MAGIARTIEISDEDKETLLKWKRSPTTPQKLVRRAAIILAAAEGLNNKAICERRLGSVQTVCLWRKRYAEYGIEGLQDEPKPGRPRKIGQDKIAEIVATTLTPPEGMTHWSARRLAKQAGVGKTTVHRIWQAYDLKPHRVETFKFSDDPQLKEKVVDIVGLYLNPPEQALVLGVDEKSQIQALQRTQPLLQLRPGQVERHTHDYKRNGTTTLYAALNIATGEVIGECHSRHRHQEFLKFLKQLDKEVPDKELHLILDNYTTHKHEKVQRWLKRHKRFYLHFTPTGASWMNMVEIWFGILTNQAIRRGSFDSVAHLVEATKAFLSRWNEGAKPFVWTKTAGQVLAKATR